MESNTSRNRLRELHGSGYEIVDGQPNIIGWTIKDRENHRIGVVDDLLFDEEQQKVRYMIVNLKDNAFDLDKRKVLIPIGIAELDNSSDDVIIPSVATWQLRALPTYSNTINDYDEHEVYTVFSMPAAVNTTQSTAWHKPANFYEHSNFNHDNIYRNRRTGELKDQPIQRSFQLRSDNDYTTSERPGNHATSRTLENPDAIAASYRGDSQQPDDHEKLINKIQRVHAELNEIERDLRNSRPQR